MSNDSRAKASAAAGPLKDEACRRAIREDLQTNLLVEAGAGSGKTQMLAERMAAGVAKGVYQIEHMAAVTFTRKAASELRGRFHLALETKLRELQRAPASAPATAGKPSPEPPPTPRLRRASRLPGSNDPAAERLRAALGNLERFFAGTIHSFCARLLRERPVESGVSPGFTELDEVQDEELRNRAWRDFIASTRSAGDRDMLDLLETGVRPKDLESAFATICANEDVEFPPGDGVCPDPRPAWKALEKFWDKFKTELPKEIDPDTRCDLQLAALGYQRQLRVAKKRLDRPAVIASLLEDWDCESKITLYRWADNRQEQHRIRAVVTRLHADFHSTTVEPYLKQWRQYIYRLSVMLLTRARNHAAAERRRRNSLNYGDLLNLTAKVLRENAQVRRALQQKYHHLFVDEFQDTDPVQAEIVFLLAADEGAVKGAANFTPPAQANRQAPSPRLRQGSGGQAEPRAPRVDWRRVQLRRGALFVVGDPKQSIYRFRRADIEIYNTVRERFSDPSIGRVVPLTTNFRSVPALCDWANAVFAAQFPAAPNVHSPQFARLDARDDEAKTTSTNSSGLFTITHTCDDYRDVAEADAAAIARYIRAEVDAGRRTYSDFLILTRKKKARIAPYASALEALNIPIEVSGAGAFGESEEVAALTVLLRALSDPQDQLTLVNVLRGPLFGNSDRELFEYKQAGGWFGIFADAQWKGEELPFHPNASREAARAPAFAKAPAGKPSPEHRDPVGAALAALRQYYRWTRMLPAGAALDKILEHSGYLALAATTPGGVEAGDLLHAVDRVRQVLDDGGNLADAADALAADSEASNEVESLPLEPGRTDVVRLMNLHKAKGLEADVVFLADPCGGVRRWVDVHIKRDGANALGWFKVEKKSEGSFAAKLLGQHADWEQHKAAEEPYLEAEENRLLYVAATRAREMVVISRLVDANGTPAWGLLNGALGDAKELRVPVNVAIHSLQPAACSVEAQAEANAARVAADAQVNQPSWSITSVTAEAKHVARMTAHAETVTTDDATRVVAQNTPSHRADAGMAWGSLIHGLLEHAMRHPKATGEDLTRLATWLTMEEPQLRSALDAAVDTVLRVANAPFWVEAQRGDHVTEAPFAVMPSRDLLTTGVVDLLFESDRGWHVRDYKTDLSLRPDAYQQQLDAYSSALGRLGLRVADAALVQVRTIDPPMPLADPTVESASSDGLV